ncbi:MAG: DUF72 domain-containing protein [Actinobacteria bacterium]|nr:DUF72 domain-containing protein [Actinomycetota bacterium]
MGAIRIGTSGWSYKEWRGSFYPDDLRQRDELSYAADQFDTLEINGTFYRLTTPKACREWYQAAPRGFRYSVKGSRYITHNKKLSDARQALANFFASGILELREKLGPILWQLSGSLRFDPDRIEGFLELLPKDTDAAARLARDHDDRVEVASHGGEENHRLRHALEVRHDSYLVPETAGILRRHGVALAFSHSSEWPYLEEITAGYVYLRLHGPRKLYASEYGEESLRNWADRIERWRSGEQPDDARRISDAKPPPRKERDVYVYFDNDAHGHAPREAAELRDMLLGG